MALLSAAALSAAVLTACDGGVTEPPFLPDGTPTATATPTSIPTATPTPTPTPPPESGGLDGFRAFAAHIAAAVAEQDASFFADRGVEEEVTCVGDEQLGPCAGQPAGTVLSGIPGSAWQSDAFGLFPPDEFADMLEDWFSGAAPDASDEYGPGAARLFALGHRTTADGEEFLAIVTAIQGTGPATEIQRQSRVLRFALIGGNWRLKGEIFAAVSLTSSAWLSGTCAECYDHWERWEGAP